MKIHGLCCTLPDPDDRPAWAQFACLADWEDFNAAAAYSKRTGFAWVLLLYGCPHAEPVRDHATAVRDRAVAAGLMPHLIGVFYHEEWYEQLHAGGLTIPGLDPANPAHVPQIIATAHAWISAQHRVIKELFGLPIGWLTSLVNDSRAYGDHYWRPVPEPVDVIALEHYVPKGGDLAWLDRVIAHCATTRPEPIVFVLQAWRDAAGDWSEGPTAAQIDHLAAWLAHNRVIGSMAFTWNDRPSIGITGMKSLPGTRAAYEAALGVTPPV